MTDFKVELVEDNISEMYVEFKGPPDSKLFLPLCSFSSFSVLSLPLFLSHMRKHSDTDTICFSFTMLFILFLSDSTTLHNKTKIPWIAMGCS